MEIMENKSEETLQREILMISGVFTLTAALWNSRYFKIKDMAQ